MPLNPAFVGRTAAASEPLEVTRGDIRRFATAIGDRSPVCHDVEAARAAGHPDLVAPPTFLITATFGGEAGALLSDPELGLDYSVVVHGEQSFAFSRPVHAGDVLETVTRVTGIRSAGRNELMTLVTTVTSGGEPVAEVANTVVSRGTAPQEA